MVAGVWVFDVDGTILDSLTGTSLRPGTEDLLVRLRAEGCRVVLWSAGGAEYARRRAVEQGVDGLFGGFFDKDERDLNGRYIPQFLAAPLEATFVDDRPEDMPVGATVVSVSPYIAGDPFDRGLERALASSAIASSS